MGQDDTGDDTRADEGAATGSQPAAQPPVEPPSAPPPAAPPAGTPPPAPPSPGSVRWQDAATATPRPLTAGEARARDKARKAREAAEEFAREQERSAELRRKGRRNLLMGAVGVVGVAGVVALFYHLENNSRDDYDDEVSATCVRDGTNEVVAENYCNTGSPGIGGIFLFGGAPYRYYYGGNVGGIGSIARGGTLELPSGTVGRTSAGQSVQSAGKSAGSGSVTRGGFGSASHAGSGS